MTFRSLAMGMQRRPRIVRVRFRFLLATTLALSAVVLAACGGGSTVTDATSDSGSPAAWWGTKGVEVEVFNGTADPLYVWERRGGEVKTIGLNQSATFRGDRAISDDVELGATWKNGDKIGLEMDASNPTVGLPNMSFYSTSSERTCSWGLESGESNECNSDVDGVSTWIGVRRLTDTKDHKRFLVFVCGPRGIYWSGGAFPYFYRCTR